MPALVSIVSAFFTALSQLIPVVPHPKLWMPLFLGQEIPLALRFAVVAGCALAGLVYYRHDWAAMVSGFLQVILLRRKPLSLDERNLFLLAIIIGGAIGIAHLGHSLEPLEELYREHLSIVLAAHLLFGAALLWMADTNGKTLKSMTGWTVVDAVLCAALGGVALYLDASLALAILVIARFRWFYREASLKFMSLCAIALGFVQLGRLKAGEEWAALLPNAPDAPLLQWILSLVVGLLTTWILLNTLTRRSESQGFRGIATFRALVGVALIAWTFWANR